MVGFTLDALHRCCLPLPGLDDQCGSFNYRSLSTSLHVCDKSLITSSCVLHTVIHLDASSWHTHISSSKLPNQGSATGGCFWATLALPLNHHRMASGQLQKWALYLPMSPYHLHEDSIVACHQTVNSAEAALSRCLLFHHRGCKRHCSQSVSDTNDWSHYTIETQSPNIPCLASLWPHLDAVTCTQPHLPWTPNGLLIGNTFISLALGGHNGFSHQCVTPDSNAECKHR